MFEEPHRFVAVDKEDRAAVQAAWIARGLVMLAKGHVVEFRFTWEGQRMNATAENVAELGAMALTTISENFEGRIKPPIGADALAIVAGTAQ